MNVLIACEFSGRVRDAFTRLGHYAMSVDLLPSETPGRHHQGDISDVIDPTWDLLIAFPPCTHLCVSGARWFKYKKEEQEQSIGFVERLWTAKIPKIAIENPIGILSTRSQLQSPTQIIQPWQFGHEEKKATCLWLKGLPNLQPTKIVDGKNSTVHREPPGPDRWKNRSRTFQGIADAMAQQWGNT